MKRKIAVTTVLLGLSLMMSVGIASAQAEISLYVYTDRAYYGYGAQGILYVTVWNEGGAVDLTTIKVNFPWEGLYHETWDGNLTHEINAPLGKGEKKTYELPFTIPSESRGTWTYMDSARVTLNYEEAGSPRNKVTFILINMELPVYSENIMPIYYLTIVLTTAVIVVIIELYLVWKRLGKVAAAQTPT